jgi:hypothetical protein
MDNMFKPPAHFMPGPPPVMGVPSFWTCPFCNGEFGQPFQFIPNNPNSDSEYHFIECIQCQARGPHKPTYEAALAAWNSRVVAYEVT